MSHRNALIVGLLLSTSCATWHGRSFRVLPAAPNYLVRSPDSLETPFPEVLRRYNGFDAARGWMDLHPKMELRIENAYYQPGMPRKGLNGFLGTEVARYIVRSNGLQVLSVQSMNDRPKDDPPVQELIRPAQTRFRYHRFFYAIVFKRSGEDQGSVLLGANDQAALDHLAAELGTDPDSVCHAGSTNCTVFPEACSVSIEMEIVVNGAARNMLWGSRLESVAEHPSHIELLRLYEDRLIPVKLEARDPKVLRLPLLPGDHVNWN
ncbi:MAG: hypothetical protein WB992_16805 [Bryobacteraceae bacterium]